MSITRPSQEGNRRVGLRKAIRQAATLICGGAASLVQTWDLGRGGICFLSPRPITPGTRCTVTFNLPLDGKLIDITVSVKVAYSSYSAAGEFKIGAVFTDLAEEVALAIEKFTANS